MKTLLSALQYQQQQLLQLQLQANKLFSAFVILMLSTVLLQLVLSMIKSVLSREVYHTSDRNSADSIPLDSPPYIHHMPLVHHLILKPWQLKLNKSQDLDDGENSVNANVQFSSLLQALYASMDQYLQGLFVLANDPATEVQKLNIDDIRFFANIAYVDEDDSLNDAEDDESLPDRDQGSSTRKTRKTHQELSKIIYIYIEREKRLMLSSSTFPK
ncbi:hypothetical protein Dsin_024684, partial [Dipteronia sinensis]